MQTTRKKLDVRIIGASAGTGKTTKLANEFVAAVKGDGYDSPIDPRRILVCSFTNKAADELAGRIRERLVESGMWEEAQQVLAGYVGTVNSICGRILHDYSLSAGLSPSQTVIPDDMESVVFNIATESVLYELTDQIEPLAIRLSLNEHPRHEYDEFKHWTEIVKDICKMARSNGIASTDLQSFAHRSWQAAVPLFRTPPSGSSASELHDLLLQQLEQTLNQLNATNDSTKITKDGKKKLANALSRARSEKLSWHDWAEVAKANVSKQSMDIIKPVLDIARLHPAHPQLHQDLEKFIKLMFECAAKALDAYQQYKERCGLFDFVDQEQRALELLDDPAVAQSLSDRLSLILIDEFQDTSPIQLSLFLKLASLAERSIWVGDVKQAIYGFRGTDPELMKCAASKFGLADRLEVSYRSRPELIEFTNNVFCAGFASFGFAPAEVAIKANRSSRNQQAEAIEIWRCEGRYLSNSYHALANGVAELLRSNPPKQIHDPATGELRDLRGSDVAILFRKGDRASEAAAELGRLGIPVAKTTKGLLDTPECVLALSAFQYLVDHRDRLALLHMIHLSGSNDPVDNQDRAWLSQWLADPHNADQLLPEAAELDKLRPLINRMTLSEVFELAITHGQVIEKVVRWGKMQQRLSNIDALKGIIGDFESSCEMERRSVTPAGFMYFLGQLSDDVCPASSDPAAVQMMTYHLAKGLEWPVVILADLDADSVPKVERDIFCATVEPSSSAFNIDAPLDGRWIRFWPWPYGRLSKDVHLDTTAPSSPEYERTQARMLQEGMRLLYVGMTRARDVLILAPYVGRTGGGSGTQWLEELRRGDESILELPSRDGAGTINVCGAIHPAIVRTFSGDGNTVCGASSNATYLPTRKPKQEFPPFRISPSEQTDAPQDAAETAEIMSGSAGCSIISIGDRIPITGSVDMTFLGDCVHQFLAVDDQQQSEAERLARATEILNIWQITHITPESVVVASDRLNAWLNTAFGEHKKYVECPLSGLVGHQRSRGFIDLAIETDAGIAIIDHKTFPGRAEHWETKAASYLPQLRLYQSALEGCGNRVNGLYIHMPIVGKIVQFQDQDS